MACSFPIMPCLYLASISGEIDVFCELVVAAFGWFAMGLLETTRTSEFDACTTLAIGAG
jgi:hypothetical protein